MKITITVDNITITEDVLEKDMNKRISEIINAINTAHKALKPHKSDIDSIFDTDKSPAKKYETNPALVSDKPASEKQIKLLKKLKYDGDVKNLTCREVAKIIEELNQQNGFDYQDYKNNKKGN